MRDRLGAILTLLILAAIVFYFYGQNNLRSPRDGEIALTGRVARGPGQDCWILKANSGERFNFYGTGIGKLRTVGALAEMIAIPQPDGPSECRQGRAITIVEYRILKFPSYD